MSLDQFVQYLVSGLSQGSIYALVGLGFTLIHAVTRIINFAQGEFVMLGGMMSFVLIRSAGIPMPLALLMSIAIAVVIGALLYALGIRSARKASVVSLIIITIGAAILIRGIVAEVWGVDPVRPPFFTGDKPLPFLGASIHPQALWIIGTTAVVTILLHLFLTHTTLGKALKASSVNPKAASLVGIDPRVMGLVAFSTAAALGAMGGVVMAPLTATRYDAGIMLGLKGFVAASIGGFTSPLATVAGGITVGVIEYVAIGVNWGPFTSSYKDAIALVILLLILLIRSGKLAAEERAS